MIDTVLVGGGRMGEALLAGMLASGSDPAAVAVVETSDAGRQHLAGAVPGVTVGPSVAGLPLARRWGAIVAVKPADVPSALDALVDAGPHRVLSVAAGVTTAAVAQRVPRAAVLRAMPNTPALVGAGATALAAGPGAGPDDLAWAVGLLGAVGTVVTVGEDLLDAVTGLSGSGPAYVFLVAEALTEAGVRVGLGRDVARALTIQTLLGAARMLAEGDEGAEALRHGVTSPGGTTAAGLAALEDRAVRAAFAAAVVAATERAHQLGRPPSP